VTIGSIATVPGWNWRRLLARQHRLLVAVTAFLVIFIFVRLVSSGSLSYFELSSLSTNTGALALAAMGETVVFLLGGIDLSAGATLSLVNVTLASQNGDSFLSQITMVLTGFAIGGLVGAFNGFFVAYMRLQAVVVTLASMFIILSLSLLIMPNPGGHVPEGLSKFFTGDLIPGSFPAALAVILFALVVWAVIKNSQFGTALYAVGGNVGAARASGISVAWMQFLGYVMAGLFYGAAGVMLSAQTAAGDPLVGRDLIIPILTAVILGGSQIGAGGGCLGTVFAAFTLVLISDLLLVLDISSSYTPIVESAVLVLAVISGLIGRNTALATSGMLSCYSPACARKACPACIRPNGSRGPPAPTLCDSIPSYPRARCTGGFGSIARLCGSCCRPGHYVCWFMQQSSWSPTAAH
jgi:ribose transport system permease protein